MSTPLPQVFACFRPDVLYAAPTCDVQPPRRRKSLAHAAAAVAAMLALAAASPAQTGFGSKTVGSSITLTVTVTAQAAGTVSAVKVLTAGAGGKDFTAAAGGSCSGAGLAHGGKCTQPVTFTPAYPGLRTGAVVLLNSGNQVIATAYLNGTGSGGLGLLVPSAAQSAAAAQAAAGAPVAAEGAAQTLAGDGRWQDANVGDGNPATQAELFLPSAIAADGFGNFYIADSNHNRIRMVCAGTKAVIAGAGCSAADIISTIAGVTGQQLRTPSGIAIDGAGNLYIADTGNHVVREITAATGAMTTVAGNGSAGYTGDGGLATAAELTSPFAVAFDADGDLFIADNQANAIRAVCASPGTLFGVSCPAAGDIVTVAGTGAAGFAGDGGKATAAELNGPYSVALDPSGNMFIADTENNRVRGVCASAGGSLLGASCTSVGMIATVTGDGNGTFSGDGGAASTAEVNSPSGLAFDPAGNLYIADTQNDRIRKINANTGIIITLAGNGSPDYGGDGGPALVAGMHGPYGLAFYNASPGGASPLAHLGDLLIADFFDQRIRSIQTGLAIENIVNPVRQGFTSPAPTTNNDPTLVTVENDGNAPLDLTTLVPGANTEMGTQAIAGIALCANGNTLTVGTQCTVEPIFAPAATPPLTTPTEAETGNIDVNNDTVSNITAANSPLVITINGTATLVNPTTVALTSNPNPSIFSQSVTLTATVAIGSGSGTPTGNVTFFDGTTQMGTPVTITAAGVARFPISTLTVGSHTITATYNGDANDASSTSSPLAQIVNEGTKTILTPSANPSALNTSVTFTATVAASAGGGVTPDGTVTFLDGAITLATVPLTAGTATYSTSTLSDGVHLITAVYSGDAATYVLGSTSAVLKQDVLAGSTVVLTSSLNPSTYGTAVKFTATVTSDGTTAPTGTVNFLDGGAQIGSASTAGTTGVASFTTTSLAAGTHTITAAYQGSPNVGPGTSNTVNQLVDQTQTNTALTAAPSPGIAGKPVTLTAKVTLVTGSATITGSVSFTDNGAALSSATLGAGGIATLPVKLTPGTHTLVAVYGGDTNDKTSTSPSVTEIVNQATTQVALTSSGSPAVVLSSVSFKAVVTGNGGTPTGNVTFNVDGASAGTGTLDPTGTATFSTSGLAVGNHSVVAAYRGDTDDASSSSAALSIVITAIPTVTDLGLSSTGGATPQTILVAATLAATGPVPTGTITFNNGATVIGTAPLDSSGVATMVPDLPPGKYSIVANYGGDKLHSPSSSSPVSISGSPAGFSISVAPPSISLVSGQNGTVTVSITSEAGFSDNIGMGCLSLPAAVNCHFSTSTVALKSGQTQTVQLTIDTNAPLSGGSTASAGRPGGMSLAGVFALPGLLLGWLVWRFRRTHAAVLVAALALVLAGAFAITGCGGSFSQVTAAPGTYTLQVGGIGASSNTSHYQNVKLTVTK